jgi:uncharacterized protein YqgV (UPF0045/DUF77 family)
MGPSGVVIDGTDWDEVLARIKKIEERLLIITPTEQIEKVAALKNAYDHYKMIEALTCQNDK